MVWRLAFAGAPPFAATVLQALLASQHRVELVYTQPNRPAGRGRKPTPSAVRRVAEAAGIEVRTPTRVDGEAAALSRFDWLIVAAYGLLLPAGVLNAPKHHCLNVHASLLPRWRGAAPVERAIMAGDSQTGVSIMRVEAELDAGPVYQRRTLPIDEDTTGTALTDALARLGGRELLEVLAKLPELAPTPQDHRVATYARKLTAADAAIDWHRPATAIARQVRALSGRLAAYTRLADDIRVRVWAARASRTEVEGPPGALRRQGESWLVACGEGALEPLTVQINRGKGTPQSVHSAINGYPNLLYPGVCFGADQEQSR